MADPRFTKPNLVHEVIMDLEEPEQFVLHRIPTHYRIRYMDRRWHRVYTKKFGKAYIVFGNVEHLIDDETMKKLTALVPTGPVANRVQEELHTRGHEPERKEGMTDERDYSEENRRLFPDLEQPSDGAPDDDIPF